MDDWRIATELAYRLGTDFDLATVDEVADEMARVAPSQLGATSALLRRARDGVVLPLRAHLDELVVRTRELSILAEDGQGTSWDPIKVAGETPADSTEAVAQSGTGASTPLTPGAGDPGDDPEEMRQAVETAHTASETADEVAPSLFEWDRHAPEASVPARDAYALRLVVGRMLYDRGRIVRETPFLADLVREPALRVNPHDLAAMGVEDGAEVRLTGAKATLNYAVVGDEAVPPGVGVMPFTADGEGAAVLIDVDAPVTDVRVETLK
jgi:predicted molibdopterin-dependent oxidoreductase YjgC